MVMTHHMLVPTIYHSAIRLMLVKGPRLVLQSAPHRTEEGQVIPSQDVFPPVGHRWRLRPSPSWDRVSV